jgi:hypothetical protein
MSSLLKADIAERDLHTRIFVPPTMSKSESIAFCCQVTCADPIRRDPPSLVASEPARYRVPVTAPRALCGLFATAGDFFALARPYVSRLRIPAAELIKPTSIAFLNQCSRPRPAGWEWVFRSVSRSSRTMGAESRLDDDRCAKRLDLSILNYRSAVPRISSTCGTADVRYGSSSSAAKPR